MHRQYIFGIGGDAAAADGAVLMLGEECIITPEGFGFTTPTERILKEAGRGVGYHKASATDTIIDVMEAITTGKQDVALVFETKESDKLLGIFTERDYIKVRICVYQYYTVRIHSSLFSTHTNNSLFLFFLVHHNSFRGLAARRPMKRSRHPFS